MVSAFRYLIACREVEDNGGLFSLRDIADTIYLPRTDFPCDIELSAVVGMFMERTAWNKSLELLSWIMGEHEGEQVALAHANTKLVLPNIEGFTLIAFKIQVPISSRGTYGFDLMDRDGVFGASEEPVATFTYGVDYED